jgi:hypothetical protein
VISWAVSSVNDSIAPGSESSSCLAQAQNIVPKKNTINTITAVRTAAS